MTKKIKDIHDEINLLTSKGRSGYHSSSQIDTAIYMASKWLYNEYYQQYERDNYLSDSLSVFLADRAALTLDVNGKATYPTDYNHETGDITSNSKPVKRVTHSQLSKRINSTIVPPTADYPICAFYKTHIQFYPITITNVKMSYLKDPVKPVYATTISNGREVYDDANSVDIEWDITDIVKITSKALEVLAQNLENPSLAQYSLNKSNKDQ
jgi:hypothetical protein